MNTRNLLLFLKLQWLEQKRSPYFQSKVIFTILSVFAGLYLFASLGFLSWHLDEIVKQELLNTDPLDFVLKVLFYYLIYDLFLRFNIQSLPILNVQAFLVLPIERKALYHHILTKSLVSFFNVIPFALFVPFFIKQDLAGNLNSSLFIYVLILILFVLINNYLNFYLKKYFSKKPAIVIIVLAVLMSFSYLDISKTYELSLLFRQLINLLLDQTILIFVPMFLLVFIYYLNYKMLKDNVYIDLNSEKSKKKFFNFKSMDFLNQRGQIAKLILLELKLIFRNKRPKTFVYLSFFYIAYFSPILIYDSSENNVFSIIIVSLMIGSFSIFYGQLLFAWESSYFDFVLGQNFSLKNYFIAKDYLLSSSIILMYLLILPIVIIFTDKFYLLTVMFIYNLGTLSFKIIYFAMLNKNPVDLSRSAFFNYEGSSLGNFLMMIPILFFPMAVYLLFNYNDLGNSALIVFIVIGITSIIFRKNLYHILEKRFEKKKFKLAEGYRK